MILSNYLYPILRTGYHDKVKQEGPLPRVRDDSARISQVKMFRGERPARCTYLFLEVFLNIEVLDITVIAGKKLQTKQRLVPQ